MNSLAPKNIDTKTTLLKYAEKLFLTHGFSGVSVRQITMASGTNVASVNYHFTDKTGLFRAVLSNLLDKITTEKLAMLEDLGRKQETSLKTTLHVYIRSFFDFHLSSPDSDRLMQIIYQEMGPDSVTGDLVADRLIVPINQAFKKTLLRFHPEMDDAQASFCVSSITGQILHFIRNREIYRSMHEPHRESDFIETIIRHITQFSSHGIEGYHDA